MKKIIAVALAAFALNASAWTGNGNDKIDAVRAYLKVTEAGQGSAKELEGYGWFVGVVAGVSSIYALNTDFTAICYPEEATSGQLAEIAANYIIDHPETRTYSINDLTWLAHNEAFGSQSDKSCWLHDRWLEANS